MHFHNRVDPDKQQIRRSEAEIADIDVEIPLEDEVRSSYREANLSAVPFDAPGQRDVAAARKLKRRIGRAPACEGPP